ncbi:MAG: cytochrome c biosis protein CcmA [Gammaproteobacteria bacterium]|jgi:heme exporter protein A|nr:cytochrome c biosis protein CcmA [Gammaproteobacteria bacterium]
MTIQLSIHEVAFERNQEQLFQPIHATLEAGELLQIQGVNGSGKSTLLRMIAGFIEPHAGRIEWQGQSIFQQLSQYQSQLHYLGHQNGIKPMLTVDENLHLQCALWGNILHKRKRASVIEAIGLLSAINTLAHQLSAGQLRRLGFAKLLLNPAKIWILDEPMTALDTEGQGFFNAILKRHLENNGIAIIATHSDLMLKSQVRICRNVLN